MKRFISFRWPGAALALLLFGNNIYGQGLLPNITVINKNGQNYLSWTSGYNSIRQIGVQRSQDSLFNYATIGYVSRPDKKVNSYTDHKPYPGANFYRLFIRLSNGSYFFSNPARSIIVPPDAQATAPSGNIYRPSMYVYTNTQGNVNISLAGADKQHYVVKFFEENGKPLFELNDIHQSSLIVDKSNFLHAGWFLFELYEDGKLREKSKFFIPDQWSN